MDFPLVISFFTDDWEYPAHAERLKKECDALRLQSRIERRESKGGYIQNTCIKPFFIRECLRDAKRPVLWIDVDGSILKPPTYFLDTNYDFQAKKMNPRFRTRTWHVGTMWFNYTPQMLAFIDAWCDQTGDMTDESALDQVYKRKEWGIRVRDIPQEYFFIWRGRVGKFPRRVVIGHRLSDGESKREQTFLFNEYERLKG